MPNLKLTLSLFLIASLSQLSACGDNSEPGSKTEKASSNKQHVWKQQTESLELAKKTAADLQKKLDQQHENMPK